VLQTLQHPPEQACGIPSARVIPSLMLKLSLCISPGVSAGWSSSSPLFSAQMSLPSPPTGHLGSLGRRPV